VGKFARGDGIHLGMFVIRLLLYEDHLILILKPALGLKEHSLLSLEHFYRRVAMQGHISKMKVVVFCKKKNT